jgi:hypothetical protein
MKKTEPLGAGTKVTLQIGNPTSATITKLRLMGWWSKLSPQGQVMEATTFPAPVQVDEDCQAGSWCSGTIILDGVKTTDLGVLAVTSASVESMTLTRQ